MAHAVQGSATRGGSKLLGAFFLLAGIFLLARPAFGSLAVAATVGWCFLFAGIFLFLAGLMGQAAGHRLWATLGGALIAIVGGLLAFNPTEGTIGLTAIFTIWLVVDGIFGSIAAFANKAALESAFGALLTVSLINLVLGVLLWVHFPSSAYWLLGVYAGIALIFRGFAELFAPSQSTLSAARAA